MVSAQKLRPVSFILVLPEGSDRTSVGVVASGLLVPGARTLKPAELHRFPPDSRSTADPLARYCEFS